MKNRDATTGEDEAVLLVAADGDGGCEKQQQCPFCLLLLKPNKEDGRAGELMLRLRPRLELALRLTVERGMSPSAISLPFIAPDIACALDLIFVEEIQGLNKVEDKLPPAAPSTRITRYAPKIKMHEQNMLGEMLLRRRPLSLLTLILAPCAIVWSYERRITIVDIASEFGLVWFVLFCLCRCADPKRSCQRF